MKLRDRWAGVLMHPTSLPGPGPTGTIGAMAHWFVDRLADHGFSAWQVLPLCPPGPGGSPYASWSSMMGSPVLIDLPMLADQGLLTPEEAHPGSTGERVDPKLLSAWQLPMLMRAAERFVDQRNHPLNPHMRGWVRSQRWLTEAVRFAARKDASGGLPWWEWPKRLRSRDLEVLTDVDAELASQLEIWRALAFFFDWQWGQLRVHASRRGITLIGDLPLYVSDDSADCWSRPDLFELDGRGRPTAVSGCPPDYFSPLGQRWGNPLYRWEAHAAERYRWWIRRSRRTLELVDQVRIDHFRGFSAGWAIPVDAADARAGEWREAPGGALFAVLHHSLGSLPFIAEDLGEIDEPVQQLITHLRLRGMRVLQFGFDQVQSNPHHPDAVIPRSVVYPGTHDNDTAAGWFKALSPDVRARVAEELGCGPDTVASALIGAALDSAASGAVIPVQDLLGLGSEARMNTPGTSTGNWLWRLTEEQAHAFESLAIRASLKNSRRA